jgi:threonine dehydrogenase-like Zn-dependent dehydrogenase
MLAVVKDRAKRGVSLEEVPVPAISPYEVLVRVRAVGICGSDQRIYNEVNPEKKPRRFVIGHEIAGQVASCGERVQGFQPGAAVAIEICIGCAICKFCKIDHVNLCQKLEELGVTMDGGMAEYVAVPERNLHRIPPGMSFVQATLADPLACVIRGLEMVRVEQGSWVAILGPGQMGLLATQVVKRILKARVAVVGTRADRLLLAKDLGADAVVNLHEVDPVSAVRELTEGGADYVFEAAGTAAALGQGIAMARKGGAVVLLTVHKDVQVNMEPAIRHELKLYGSICYNRREYDHALGLLAQGKVDAGPLMAHTFALSQVEEAFDFVLSRRGVKAILIPGAGGGPQG